MSSMIGRSTKRNKGGQERPALVGLAQRRATSVLASCSTSSTDDHTFVPADAAASVTCHAETTSPHILNPWQRYCLSLEQNPFLTKALTSFCGFMLGDMLAQNLEGSPSLNFERVLHLGLYGFLLDGPVGHLWYKWLDGTCDKTFVHPKGTAAVATKTAADQLVWAPIMTCAFFAFLKLVEGHPELMWPTIEQKALATVAANYVIWPAAHVVSFKYVPSHQRILYNNVIAIFWNCYLSIVAADQGMDASMLGGIDGSTAADLVGLRDIAHGIQATLPVENDWLADLFQFGSPATQKAVQALEKSGISSPFIERMIAIQTAVLH